MIHAQASPNIAFIKYWGKRESLSDETRNIGCNPSLSMTLSKAKTFVDIDFATGSEHEIFVGGVEGNKKDRTKIVEHLQRVAAHFEISEPIPALRIDSRNNFPQSAGMASSASAFCALTLAFVATLLGKNRARDILNRDPALLSMLARRGSGSAARSVAGGYMYWDTNAARSLDIEWPLCDTIVMLSRAKKNVSSSEGHSRVHSSPRFLPRLATLEKRTSEMIDALQAKDLQRLGPLLETEALEMHAVAESSVPPIEYLNAEARRLLKAIQAMPERHFFVTIDAGPNLHLISEAPIADQVRELLAKLKISAEIWEDALGTGPSLG